MGVTVILMGVTVISVFLSQQAPLASTAVCYVFSLELNLSQDKQSSALITFPLLFASSEKDVSIDEPQLGQCRDVLTLKCSVTTKAVFPPISWFLLAVLVADASSSFNETLLRFLFSGSFKITRLSTKFLTTEKCPPILFSKDKWLTTGAILLSKHNDKNSLKSVYLTIEHLIPIEFKYAPSLYVLQYSRFSSGLISLTLLHILSKSTF